MLSPEERQKIYEEEKARAEIREQVQREIRESAGLGKFDQEADRVKKNLANGLPILRGAVLGLSALILGIPALFLMYISPATTVPVLLVFGVGAVFFFVMKRP